jgi:hypothetical protein
MWRTFRLGDHIRLGLCASACAEAGLNVPVHITTENMDLSGDVSVTLLRILGATEPESSGAVLAGSHHQELSMFAKFVGLREVKNGILRLVIVASSQNPGACSSAWVQGSIPPNQDRLSHGARVKQSGEGICCPSGERPNFNTRMECFKASYFEVVVSLAS